VTKSSLYEPTLNQAFENFALHYSTTILPARSLRPKDKSLVEGAVRIAYQRIYSVLDKKVFHSLEELNDAIKEIAGRMVTQQIRIIWQAHTGISPSGTLSGLLNGQSQLILPSKHLLRA
jgi:hypothetical protein